MKLKTLKGIEIELHGRLEYGIIKKAVTNTLINVQQEAIKWVKNCEYRGKTIIACEEDGYRCIACQRTMKMNNISEEDL